MGATGRIVRDDQRGPITSVLLLVATQITALHMAVQFKFVINFLYDLGFFGFDGCLKTLL